VYDLTVPGTDSFMVNDGILVHNTLKAFHFSGIAAMGTTNLGVPRIKELLNNSKNIKTPKMFIYLKDNVMRDKTIANTIANHLKYTKIVDLQTEIGVYYDPNPNDNSYMKHDGVSSTVFYSMSFNKMKYTQNYESLPWLLRIVFDREKLYTKEVTLLDIKTKFCNEWKKKILDNKFMNKDDRDLYDKIINISVLSTPEHGKNPIVHIRFNINNVNYEILNKFMTNCEEFRMKGLDELTEINVNYDENMVNYDPETGDTKMDKNNVLYSTGINMVDIRHIESININKTY
jgi:DNA-directed RNA polymerase II subunit RPB1